jgi:glutathione S-transferase
VLKILGRASSINVRKVLWTCAEIGLPFEREDWGIGFQPTSDPTFTALNPNALVPVVRDGDFVLWESNTICRWLASEQQRDDLLPRAPRDRALVERWMDWQATELNSAWRYAFYALVRNSAQHQDAKEIEASVAQWNRTMRLLDAQLKSTGAFAAGPRFTLADIVLGVSTHRWLSTPIERPTLPHVAAHHKRLCERPGFQIHVPGGGA